MIRGRLAILGAGGHGKMVAEAALSSGWESVHFYDDLFPNKKLTGSHVVMGSLEDLFADFASYNGFHVAIGSNNIRLLFLEKLRGLDLNIPNIIHSSAIISATASLADGVCIMPGVVVNADCEIGTGVILNSSSVIDHDCKISSGAHVSSGALLAGEVTVGYRTWIGIGASVIQGIKIGSDAIIGAGSVVISDIPNEVTSVGVPSQVIR